MLVHGTGVGDGQIRLVQRKMHDQRAAQGGGRQDAVAHQSIYAGV
jgi:hypothetical protein